MQEHASALRSAAALLDSDFEHPGEKKAVSKAIQHVSCAIQPHRAYSLWLIAGVEESMSPHFIWPSALQPLAHTPLAIRYKLLNAECAALIVYSISRLEWAVERKAASN